MKLDKNLGSVFVEKISKKSSLRKSPPPEQRDKLEAFSKIVILQTYYSWSSASEPCKVDGRGPVLVDHFLHKKSNFRQFSKN